MSAIPNIRFPEFDKGWDLFTILELSPEGFSNGVFNDPNKVGTGYPLVNVKDMYSSNTIDVSQLTLVDISKCEFEKNKVLFGDIFFTRSSLVKEGIAHSNVYLEKDKEVTYDGHLIRMRPDLELVDSFFLHQNLKTHFSRKQLVARGKTGTMTTIGQNDIADVKLAIPNLPEQKKIADFLEAVDDKIAGLRERESLLTQYKKGVMQKIFTQTLRFKADDGRDFPDWKKIELGEVLDYEQPTKYLVSSTEYSDDYSLPVLTAGKTFILGYTDETNGVFEDLPVIIFDDFTTANKFVDFRFKAKSSAMKMLKLKNDKNDLRFVYEAMQMIRFPIGEHKRYWISEYQNWPVMFPCLKEQQKIADFLSAIDAKITAVSAQVTLMQDFKKGLLQQMFV